MAMVRNPDRAVTAAVMRTPQAGGPDRPTDRGRGDFNKLHIPFTYKSGDGRANRRARTRRFLIWRT